MRKLVNSVLSNPKDLLLSLTVAALMAENTIFDTPEMPETIGNTKPYVYFFPNKVLTVTFSLLFRHRKGISNNKIKQL